MEGRSIWTGKHGVSLVPVELDARMLLGSRASERFLVEAEHEAELPSFVAEAERARAKFWTAFIVGTLLAVVGGIFSIAWSPLIWAVPAGLLTLGVTMLVFPFATPQTIRMLGLRRSRTLVRWSSLLMFGMAAWLVVLSLRQ